MDDKLDRVCREGEMVYLKAVLKQMLGGTGKITNSLSQVGKYREA
jgi:hypothetical protein